MKEDFELGEVVRHKASRQEMVVLVNVESTIKCRYQNPVTGLYEVQEFRKSELQKGQQKIDY